MKNLYLLLFFLASVSLLPAQNFNYTLTRSASTYQSLTAATSINNNTLWDNQRIHLPVGFSFHYLGAAFDSLTFDPNGFIVFDKNRNYAFTGFYGVTDKKENNTSLSPLLYQLSGNVGGRILKVEYNNCLLSYGTTGDTLNYQVWFHEGTNKVELHIGPNTYSQEDNPDAIIPFSGLINMNNNTETMALLLSGNAESPVASTILMGNDFVSLSSFPASGNVYVFTPVNGN